MQSGLIPDITDSGYKLALSAAIRRLPFPSWEEILPDVTNAGRRGSFCAAGTKIRTSGTEEEKPLDHYRKTRPVVLNDDMMNYSEEISWT